MEFGKEPEIEQSESAVMDAIVVEGSCVHIDKSMMDKASAAVTVDFSENEFHKIYKLEYSIDEPAENILFASMPGEINFGEPNHRF